MTIILQYQFWDLKVDDGFFEVGLHFKNVPERLHVPFDAVSGFYDPSVQFGLKFEPQGEEGEDFDEDDEETILGPVANPQRSGPVVEAGKPKLRGAGSEPAMVPAKGAAPFDRQTRRAGQGQARQAAGRRGGAGCRGRIERRFEGGFDRRLPQEALTPGNACKMGEIVNLRRARKARERRRDEDQAQENRIRHGLSKAERQMAEKARAHEAKRLDGHRLGEDETPPAPEGEKHS